ncbi:MAG: shikimate dehydrogenase [Bifidobacteriaceae bacterium]|jgi:shikimate dehydrogenase|nr:shikimate dehydrogenase [Bifidobacteriaceae bacterium]
MTGSAKAARRAAVLGSPIAHSLSPALHLAAYQALGLDGWQYSKAEMTEADLPGFLQSIRVTQSAADPESNSQLPWAGLSLTMPLKHAVLGLVDFVEPLAKAVGAANTVIVSRAGLTAANSDVYGIVAAIRETAPNQELQTAAILGGGATAASSLAALAELGIKDPEVYVRSLERSRGVAMAAARLHVEPVFRKLSPATRLDAITADVVISTLPAHAADWLAPEAGGAASAAMTVPTGRQRVLLDAAYEPWPSRLATVWAGGGGLVASGKLMLLHQAALQVQMMTGYAAPIAAMRQAID